MRTVESVEELREHVATWRACRERVALVPTMGNLHAGHLALVKHASDRADRVVVSIFVNPTQFGPEEDYGRYPRTLDADLAALDGSACDLAFVPEVKTLYPFGPEQAVAIHVPGISGILEGERRPGHFDGVSTVVTRLFQMAQPDLAAFGEKDYQQLQVIRHLIRDLAMPVEIDGVPTVREADGLALSSRNQYLTPEERRAAPELYHALCDLAARVEAGGRDFRKMESSAVARLEKAGFRPEYVAVRRADLGEPGPGDRALRVLAAARLGRARLIDNVAAAG